MKTIKVSDEMYDFLMDLSKELNTQDHRGTRMPYFFQIQEQKEIAVPEGCGQEAWHLDGCLLKTNKEIKEAIFDYKEWDETNQKKYDNLLDYEKDEILESIGYHKVNYDYEEVYHNAFLTSRACDEHIKKNHYHYNDPVNYLTGSFRNPELEMVFKFLCELSGGKLHI